MSDETKVVQVAAPPMHPEPPKGRAPLAIAGLTALLLVAGGLLFVHARGSTNQVALASKPKGVTVVEAKATTFREKRRYVGTLEPWLTAKVGPQLVSAYVDTVLVRPGDVVKRGQVIATLDCRNASAVSQAVSMQARALEASQLALSNEAARVSALQKGGYASADEAEMKKAESESKQAQLLALRAQAAGSSLQVEDCVLRAPFDGEVAERLADPGAYVRPGAAIATLIDRRVVRLALDVPETDFTAVAPGTPVKIRALSTGEALESKITRRAPSADGGSRTVHVEVDLANAARTLPVGTTAEARLEVGEPVPALQVPLAAATVRGKKATLVVVEAGTAHRKSVAVRGESEGALFVDPELRAGAQVVLEGRGGLAEGDAVEATLAEEARPTEEKAVQVQKSSEAL